MEILFGYWHYTHGKCVTSFSTCPYTYYTTHDAKWYIFHVFQIPADEYKAVICQLMEGTKFKCHIWCYNMPLAIFIFAVLLALCLIFIPIIESHILFQNHKTGLEFVHGGIVWLCMLTLYMILAHLVRRKVIFSFYMGSVTVKGP